MPDDEEEIYEQHVMRHYEEPYHNGHLGNPTHVHRSDNPVCGDSVQIELKFSEDGVIEEAWFVSQGCCLSQASASMLVQRIEGMSVADVMHFGAGDMLKLFGARLTARRLQCCLLPWKALQLAIHSSMDSSSHRGN